VKKRTSDASTTTSIPSRRRRGNIVRYLIVAVGCVLIIDALVGDRGFLAMLKARQQYRSLEGSLVRSREENAQLREQAASSAKIHRPSRTLPAVNWVLIRPGEKLFIIKDVK
jgi:hypothetical protein